MSSARPDGQHRCGGALPRLSAHLSPSYEALIPELETAREAERRRPEAQRRRSGRNAAIAAREADDALLRAFQRSREATDRFIELEGWADAGFGLLLRAVQ
jgi:hypothetical protein